MSSANQPSAEKTGRLSQVQLGRRCSSPSTTSGCYYGNGQNSQHGNSGSLPTTGRPRSSKGLLARQNPAGCWPAAYPPPRSDPDSPTGRAEEEPTEFGEFKFSGLLSTKHRPLYPTTNDQSTGRRSSWQPA